MHTFTRKLGLNTARLPSVTYRSDLSRRLHSTPPQTTPPCTMGRSTQRTHLETARTSGAKLSILPSAALSLCCRISRNERFSTRTASSCQVQFQCQSRCCAKNSRRFNTPEKTLCRASMEGGERRFVCSLYRGNKNVMDLSRFGHLTKVVSAVHAKPYFSRFRPAQIKV